ncbi:hypothetical protein B0H14DRAFT_2824307 [Mycena olivaceomarginata]|nr:hypothetical protein B0H14DRAFT_2824307 [Mycena olivaceomarginata]
MDATFSGLPNELIIQILNSDTSCEVARLLSGTSKQFQALALPVLFRDVRLQTHDGAMMFFSVVHSDLSRADHVRSLTMPLGSRGFGRTIAEPGFRPYFISDRWHVAQSRKVAESLKSMANLEHLTFNHRLVEPVDYHNLLQRHTFPRLTSCEMDVLGRFDKTTHDYNLLAAFWNRHRTLARVFCPDLMRASRPSLRIAMPNLEYLETSPILVPLLDVASRRLREVRMVWYPWQAALVEQVMRAIQAMTEIENPFVASQDFFGLETCYALVDAISRNLPQTRMLRMRRIGQYNELQALDGNMLAGITEYLSRFADLVYFGMENRYRLTLGPPRTAADRLVVESWADACPTLQACCLNSVAWVKVSGVWTVAPLERFYELADRVHLAIRTPIGF